MESRVKSEFPDSKRSGGCGLASGQWLVVALSPFVFKSTCSLLSFLWVLNDSFPLVPRLPVIQEGMLWTHSDEALVASPGPQEGSTLKLASEEGNTELSAPGGREWMTGAAILTLRGKAQAGQDVIKRSLALQSGKKED